MPKRERSAGTKVAVGELLVVAYIRPAYAGRLNLDLKLACRRFFETSSFLMIGQINCLLCRVLQKGKFKPHVPCGGRLLHAGRSPGCWTALKGTHGLVRPTPGTPHC
jgi:hypothetical protein